MMHTVMDDRTISRSYLETLSSDDLRAMALRLGLDFADGLVRSFLIEELLEAQVDDEEFADGDLLGAELPHEEGDAFEERYHETYIGVIVRDPLWAYAYWEMRDFERGDIESHHGFQGFQLRVVPLDPGCSQDECFSIPISAEDRAWYLSLQGTCGRFKVELCSVISDSLHVLATSRVVFVPHSGVIPLDQNGDPERILALSGFSELKVLRVTDSPSRLPIRCEG